MSRIWLTSDTHFYSKTILLYENRPYDTVSQMNADLIKNWNDVVRFDDIVFHLGDFGLSAFEELREVFLELNGKITLVRGDNDDTLTNLLDIGFDAITDKVHLAYKHWEFVMTHIEIDEPFYDDINHPYINLHGHTQGKITVNRNRINVGCDSWQYTPVNIDEVLVEYKKQRKKYELPNNTSL